MYREMNNTAESQAFITNLHALKRVAEPEELARSVSPAHDAHLARCFR